MEPIWITLPLGIGAGVLTTVAGLGGGLVVTLVLAAAWDPHHALAVSAPGLLIGNLHRLWLFGRALERSTAAWLAAPALVGALVGGLVTAALPAQALHWLLLAVTGLALAREAGTRWVIPTGRAWLAGGGLMVGLVTATTGGGGLLLAPLLLAAGLRGSAFVASAALVAAAVHVGRVVGYGGTGLLGAAELPAALLLGVGMLAGNAIGRRLRPRLGDRACHRFTWVVLAGGLALALLGTAG